MAPGKNIYQAEQKQYQTNNRFYQTKLDSNIGIQNVLISFFVENIYLVSLILG